MDRHLRPFGSSHALQSRLESTGVLFTVFNGNRFCARSPVLGRPGESIVTEEVEGAQENLQKAAWVSPTDNAQSFCGKK